MLLAALTAVAVPTFAQQATTAPAADAAASAASASKGGMDCAATGMKRHGHAAEKGMGSGMKGKHCNEKAMPSAKAEKKEPHDHGTESKQP